MVEEIMVTSNNYINKKDFLHLYPPTRETVFPKENICGGFIEAGLKLLDRDQVLEKITFQFYTLTPLPLPLKGLILSAF